jgi:hypothetical protein
MATAFQHVKVYGERNTGTNFLMALLRKNFAVSVWPAFPEQLGTRRNPLGRRIAAERAQLIANMRQYGRPIRLLAVDRFSDIQNRKHMDATLGWKHMAPPIAYLKGMPEITSKTLFIVLVKHPVFWALSYQKHPYHSYFPVEQMSFSEFVRHVFIPTFRDNLEVPFYESIVDLYGAKVDAYRDLSELGVAIEIVRYENLIADIAGFLDVIETRHNLSRTAEEAVVRERSMKHDVDATLLDFREKYRLARVTEAVSPEDYEFIMSRFGAERLAWLGYPAA